jgi:dephospho-CoA kinase
VTFVVGLTGGIGSGKSAAAREFERLGASVVDTDAIARELTAPGGAALEHIKALFGEAFIGPSGALEELLHPMIRGEAERRIAAARAAYVIYVVPLLVESGDYRSRVDRVLVVDAPEALQLERVHSRSGLPEREARAIMAQQLPRAARLAAADDVIDNSGALDALRTQVAALHARYLKMAAQARA